MLTAAAPGLVPSLPCRALLPSWARPFLAIAVGNLPGRWRITTRKEGEKGACLPWCFTSFFDASQAARLPARLAAKKRPRCPRKATAVSFTVALCPQPNPSPAPRSQNADSTHPSGTQPPASRLSLIPPACFDWLALLDSAATDGASGNKTYTYALLKAFSGSACSVRTRGVREVRDHQNPPLFSMQ